MDIENSRCLVNVVDPTLAESAGSVVWWRLSGSVSRVPFETAWKDAGLEDTFKLTRPTVAASLYLAMQNLTTKDLMCRRTKDGGLALVKETRDGKNLDYEVLLRAYESNDEFTEYRAETSELGLSATLNREFQFFQGNIEVTEASNILTKMLMNVDSVTLRPMGGVYFIPCSRLDLWRKTVDVMRAHSSHKFFFMPAMNGDDMVEAVLDSLMRETEKMSDMIEESLDNDALGKRALAGRMNDVMSLRGKLERYEKMLGSSQDDLKRKLDVLKSNIAQAILLKESNDK